MTHRTLISTCEDDTIAIAAQVADAVAKRLADHDPILIGLTGDLGAGKSVFARSFIRRLMGDEQLHVPSPTFTLVQYYDSPDAAIYHYDLYRLEDADEIYEIGWEESLASGVSLIEWPSRLLGIKPHGILDIQIQSIHNSQRREISLPSEFSLGD